LRLDAAKGGWHLIPRAGGEMDHLSGSASVVAILVLVAIVVGVALIVCWIVLPFAVIGTKPLIRELIREQQMANKLVEAQTRAFEVFAARYASGIPQPPL